VVAFARPKRQNAAVIHGDRVRLRRIERADLPQYVAWLNDPELRRHLAALYPMSQAQEEQWFESTLRLEPALQPFGIEARLRSGGARKKEDWTLVGSIGLHNVDWKNRSGEVGLFIGPQALWGKGYGTAALKSLLGFAFGELNLHRVWLRVFEDNTRALGSYEKCGFTREGRLRQDRFHDGRYHDTLILSILRNEWQG
jgi:RimJ/RimL family protein N-acetyltransferase